MDAGGSLRGARTKESSRQVRQASQKKQCPSVKSASNSNWVSGTLSALRDLGGKLKILLDFADAQMSALVKPKITPNYYSKKKSTWRQDTSIKKPSKTVKKCAELLKKRQKVRRIVKKCEFLYFPLFRPNSCSDNDLKKIHPK